MLLKCCLSIFVLICLFPFAGLCKEPIPRSDFIKLTENALDTLDEVESVLNYSTPKAEIQKALNKARAADMKYKRYVPDVWPKGVQSDIVGQIAAARYYYGVYFFSDLQSEESINSGKAAGIKARELFRKYKNTTVSGTKKPAKGD